MIPPEGFAVEKNTNNMNAKFQTNAVILLLFVFVLFNARCQKYDEGGGFSASDLYGTWKCNKIFTYLVSVRKALFISEKRQKKTGEDIY